MKAIIKLVSSDQSMVDNHGRGLLIYLQLPQIAGGPE
jgi:hypothetical protein